MAITEDLVSSAVILLCGVCEKQLQEEGKASSTGPSSDQYWFKFLGIIEARYLLA